MLRWLGPLWLLLLLVASVGWWLAAPAVGGYVLAGVLSVLIGLPLLDWLLQRGGIQLSLLRGWRYFVAMNLALGLGWWRFMTGEQRGIWTPPQRG